MKNKHIVICILACGLCVPSYFLSAQNTQDPIQVAPNGQGTIAPNTYGENNVFVSEQTPNPIPVYTPLPAVSPAPVTVPKVSTPSVNTTPQVKESNFLNNITTKKLKIILNGIDKSCMVGKDRPTPWTLVDGGVEIDSQEELLVVLNQALTSDTRIRQITVKQNILEIDYLQPARLFSVIPINYLFKIVVDVNTMTTHIINPRWLSFGATYHTQVSQTLLQGLSQIYTPQNMEYVSKQNIFYKHSFVTAATTAIMTPIDVYPFAGTFWICTIVPFFVVFLILFGILFGILLYWITKRRREQYIKRVRNDYEDNDHIHTPIARTRISSNQEDPKESLDEYINSKRFK